MKYVGFYLYKDVPIVQKDFVVPTEKLVDMLYDLKLLSYKLVKEGKQDRAQLAAKNAVYIYDLILSQSRTEEMEKYYENGVPF